MDEIVYDQTTGGAWYATYHSETNQVFNGLSSIGRTQEDAFERLVVILQEINKAMLKTKPDSLPIKSGTEFLKE